MSICQCHNNEFYILIVIIFQNDIIRIYLTKYNFVVSHILCRILITIYFLNLFKILTQFFE